MPEHWAQAEQNGTVAMQFLRTAFWVVIAVVIALFSKANWDIQPSYSGRVPIKLWEDWILLIRLPVLIVAAFLLGLLPMWLFARISRWRFKRRLETAEQALAATLPVAVPVAVITPEAPMPEPVSEAATDESQDMTRL
jgi:ABC-type long-subunit fatty acid transport system fused permease/ATPase subunit